MKVTKENELIELINKQFPGLNAVSGEYFDGSENSIWFKGTESADINGEPILNIYSEVHEELDKFLNKHGWYGSPYDSGTLLAYKN